MKQHCSEHRAFTRGCEGCRAAAKVYKQDLRDRKRGIKAAALTVVEGGKNLPPEPLPSEPALPGAVEVAVQSDLDKLNISAGCNALAAAALAMGRILDDRRLVTTQPSAARQLEKLMSALRREAAPRRGRLAAVQDMTTRG